MIPTAFKEHNKVLGKPSSMTDDECFDLEIFTNGIECISCWKLNKEDLEEINKTGLIWLRINSGQTQPPVNLQTESPFYETPHEVGRVACDTCNHSWIAVRPDGTEKLECPNCHNFIQL